MITIINADAVKWAQEYQGELFHAMLCDAPYHLYSPASHSGTQPDSGVFGRSNGGTKGMKKGFMGKDWDGGDVAFRVETWEAFYSVLLPGAFGMAFGGSRTSHRMATAIEDAGFIIHPSITWCFGSGFPKSTRIDTQVDRTAGEEQKIVGRKTSGRYAYDFKDNSGNVVNTRDVSSDKRRNDISNITEPSTPLAKAWEGHRYGLQALKPAAETIIVFQKPYEGKPVDCITKTGAGALWIEGARIEYSGEVDQRTFGGEWKTDKAAKNVYEGGYTGNLIEASQVGRWPANFILTHDYSCKYNKHSDTWNCVDGCSVKAMGEQSGERHPGNGNGNAKVGEPSSNIPLRRGNLISRNDFGTAARFFFNADYMYERLENSDPFIYQAKVSRSERDAGLEERELTKRNTMGNGLTGVSGDRTGKNDGNQKPIEAGVSLVKNPHPTLKPLSLTRYLATILLPPKEYSPRSIFIPFAGVASECIGANLAGWESVLGVEIEQEYCDIGNARADFWTPEVAANLIDKKKKKKKNAKVFDQMKLGI